MSHPPRGGHRESGVVVPPTRSTATRGGVDVARNLSLTRNWFARLLVVTALLVVGAPTLADAAGGHARRAHTSNECTSLRVDVLNTPAGAQAAVVLRGPGGTAQAFPASGTTCLATPGTYWLVARSVNFTIEGGRQWRAYPSGPRGAVAVEARRLVIPLTPRAQPLVVTINYFDQAPVSTLVLAPSQVIVPTGRFLPAFGAVALHQSTAVASLRTGDIVVAPAALGLPHGLMGTIVSMQSVNGNVSLITQATTPFRAFSRGQIRMRAVRATAQLASLGGLSAAARVRSPHDLAFGCGSMFSVTGSASFQPTVSMNLGWSWGPWYAPWQVEITGNFSLSPGVSGQLTVSDTTGVSCHVGESLPPVTIGVVCTEVGCFTFNLVVTASVDGAIDQAFTQSFSESLVGAIGASFSFGYNANGFQSSNTLQLTGSSSDNAVWQGSIGVGIGPALQVLYGIPDVGGVGPQVGVQDTATLQGNGTGWSLQGGVQASVGFDLSALGFSYSNSINVPISTFTLASGNWPLQPSPPSNVTATPDPSTPATAVDVAWVAPSWPSTCGISGYTVSVGSASTSVGANASVATVNGLTGGTAYTVTVVATTGSCGTSQATTTITTPLSPPSAPTLTAVATPSGSGQPTGEATFAAPSPCPGCAAVTGYQVVWSGDGTSATVDTAGSPATFALPAWGVPYQVTVAATSTEGTGPTSNAFTITPVGDPSSPSNVSVGVGLLTSTAYTGPAATLTWTVPDSNGGLPQTKFAVVWTDGEFTQSVTAGTEATIHLPTWGSTYDFCVIAYNTLGAGPESPCVSATAVAPPSVPTQLHLSAASANVVSLTWLAPADNGSAISAYLVQWGSAGTWDNTVVTTTSATVTLNAPGTYFFTVLARNGAGDGPTSAAVCASSGNTAPCPPIITAVSGGGLQQGPSVSWTPSTQLGGLAIVSYRVNWTGPSVGSITVGGNATSANLPLTASGTYTVVVFAANATGTSVASEPAPLTVIPYHPPPP